MSARDLLPEYALGLLTPEEAASVDHAVAADPALRRELDELLETVGTVAVGTPVGPAPAGLWARIEKDLDRPRPFAAFVDRVAAALHIGADRARALLDRIDLASSWVAGPSPESRLYHIEPGAPVLAVGGLAGFVRLAAGQPFPTHKHIGREHVLVLQGGLRDDDGTDYRAGDDSHKAEGTSHAFVAHAGEDLIYLAVIYGLVDFGDGFQL